MQIAIHHKRKRKSKNRSADRGAADRHRRTEADIAAHQATQAQHLEGTALPALPMLADTLLALFYQTSPSPESVEYLASLTGVEVKVIVSRQECCLSVQANLRATAEGQAQSQALPTDA